MQRCFLQKVARDNPFESLPPEWTSFDFGFFSNKKRLWDHQIEAVKNAVKILWRYYEWPRRESSFDIGSISAEAEHLDLKESFCELYQANAVNGNLDISLERIRRDIRDLLRSYYELSDNKLPFEKIVNRMSFWMATGSGKTLVIIKLMEILRGLMLRGKIPKCHILFLTHRDDLIEQMRRHVAEFNSARSDLEIKLRELKEHPEVKRENPSLFRGNELTVFYYRSDNISNEQKEKIIDFRNYDLDGKWYVFLDEAHKGDKEDSKRQHIY